MSNFKGTPRKWTADFNSSVETYISTTTHRICEVKHYSSQVSEKLEPTEEEGKYNALLIQKAPEMLEMLECFVEKNMLSTYGEALAYQLIKEATEFETIEEIEPLNIKEIKPIIDSCAFLLDKIERLNEQIETMQQLNKDRFPLPYTEQEIQEAIIERDEFMSKLGSCINEL